MSKWNAVRVRIEQTPDNRTIDLPRDYLAAMLEEYATLKGRIAELEAALAAKDYSEELAQKRESTTEAKLAAAEGILRELLGDLKIEPRREPSWMITWLRTKCKEAGISLDKPVEKQGKTPMTFGGTGLCEIHGVAGCKSPGCAVDYPHLHTEKQGKQGEV